LGKISYNNVELRKYFVQSPDRDHTLGPSRDGEPIQGSHTVQHNQVWLRPFPVIIGEHRELAFNFVYRYSLTETLTH
jgi:hypothetical protein